MGAFTGLTDVQWNLLERLLPLKYARGKGHPPANPRYVLNSIIWILITGARWCDLPKGSQWASKSSSHRWLGIWQECGALEKTLSAIQDLGILWNLLDFDRLAADGFFSAGKGGGEGVAYGYKGKGVTSHLLVDRQGSPLQITATGANGDERKEVKPLVKKKIYRWLKPLISRGKIPIFEADKGYDSKDLRLEILALKIFPLIPYRKMGTKTKNGINNLKKNRWIVERAISWLQRKFRRIIARWERRWKY